MGQNILSYFDERNIESYFEMVIKIRLYVIRASGQATR